MWTQKVSMLLFVRMPIEGFIVHVLVVPLLGIVQEPRSIKVYYLMKIYEIRIPNRVVSFHLHPLFWVHLYIV